MPSLALSAEIRLCRLRKVLARYSEGNLSSSVIRLGKCQGADAQEQRCCSSQIPNHCPPTPPPNTPPHFIFSTHSPNQPLHLSNLSCHSLQNPSALSTIPSQSRGQAALAARGAADLLPAANAANQMPPTSVESKKSALFKCFPQPKHIAEITARLTNICHWPVRISITSALKPDILKPCSCLE